MNTLVVTYVNLVDYMLQNDGFMVDVLFENSTKLIYCLGGLVDRGCYEWSG